jgi:hypothetical protein
MSRWSLDPMARVGCCDDDWDLGADRARERSSEMVDLKSNGAFEGWWKK